MKVERFVMAYSVEQDRIRAMLPEGFESLRPVLRLNAEIRDEKAFYIALLPENAARIACRQMLGQYKVVFVR